MKTLYLLRHAKSSWNDQGLADFDRPLSGRGKQACRLLRDALRGLKIAPELVLCSAAQRAQETLERIAPALPEGHAVSVEKGLYLASAGKLLARLHRLDNGTDSVMVVGHNPGLQNLAVLLAGSGDKVLRERLAAKFPTAALAGLRFKVASWREVEVGGGRLAKLWTPREATTEHN
jgi:phosphohistidine phosphatase